MRLRTIGLAATVSLGAGLVQTSDALVRPKGAETDSVSADRAPRMHRGIAWDQSGRLATTGLPGWKAMYDRDTDVPLRLWGKGVVVVGALTDPAIAEASARAFLATHLAVLAPGAAPADFVLVANQLGGSGDVRTVGFAQRAHGVPVLGGSIGFAFKNDRMMMVSSTALPNVSRAVAMPSHTLAPGFVAQKAAAWLAADGHTVAAQRSGLLAAPSERVIVPIVRPRGAHGIDVTYQVAEQLAVVATRGVGRWNVWMDAQDGRAIARKSTVMFATGKVLFDVPVRSPSQARAELAAPLARHLIDNTVTEAAFDGTVTWAGDTAATVIPKLIGSRVAITNQMGSLVTASLTLEPNASVVWSQATNADSDAQLTSYVHANIVKEFVRTHLDANLAWLEGTVAVTVNENDECNAYSTGDDVHFFRAGQCENTGRLADVVYHEIGHSVHAQSIIAGQGGFDGSLSEGLADVLSSSITNDAGLGRGFFFSDAPLRDLDPVGVEKRWPEDADGEVHNEGEIIGGTLWDLRKGLIAKLGQEAGFDRLQKIYYGIMQRAVDIPSSYLEALVADDDDGDLLNGTPNQCVINTAFGAHGLADPSVTVGVSPPVRDAYQISFAVADASQSECPGPTVMGATVEWRPRGGTGGTINFANTSATTWSGLIPQQGDGTVIEYRVEVKLSDGTAIAYPRNAADPYYQFYVGEVTKLWCADFENGVADWTHSANPSGRDEWEVGTPRGLGGDPTAAFSGSNVFGIDLTSDGQYRAAASTYAETPEIDLQGNTKNIHLQYRRWLGIEDGFYDQASISANSLTVWKSFASVNEPMAAGVDHIDREWRFQDVDVSAQAAGGKMQIRFGLSSDEGLEFSGWNLDEVCIVVAAAPPAATCGDLTIGEGETCEDGNGEDGDGCSASCQLEDAGDGGCCSSTTNPTGAAGLGALVFGLMFRRRRRR